MDGDAASKAEDDAHKVRSDAKKLPWEERLSHKVAMVRFDACEDISEAAGRALSPQDSVLDELADLLPKAVGDSNANVMDKGLEAAARVLEKGGEMHATRCAQGICKMVMSKCLTSRPATLKKVKEVLMLLVEQEQQATVINALVGDGFGHKVPKAVAAAANLALDIYTEFGARAVKPELALKAMPKLFESKDATSRDAAKRLTVVMAQWVGRASVESVLLEKMRDAMKKDVDVWLSNLPDEKPKAARLTRKAAAIQKAKEDAARKAAASGVQEGGAVREHGQAAASASIWAADDEEEDGARGVDKYDLADPVDILPQLKKDFWGGLSSSKWMDRRDALQSLKSLLTDNPKLESGVDYHDLNSELRKVITKDANVACVSEAIHCAGGLASGLRPSYKGAALQFAPLILDKFKEKNSSVVAACHASLIAMAAHCFHLVDISEDVVAALKHTNPKVKQETLKWLGEVIRSHDEAFAKKLHKGLLPTLVKSAEEPTPAIRDAAMVVLAELAAKAGSLAPLEKAIAGLDDAKKKKLTAMAQAAISGDAPPASPPPVSAPARVSSATTTCPPAARPSTASGRASNARAPAKTKASCDASAASTSAKEEMDDPAALSSSALTGDEAIAKLAESVGEDAVKALKSANWNERLHAMADIVEKAPGIAAGGGGDALVFGLAALPGWSEKNFQVLGKAFEVCRITAEQTDARFGKAHAFCVVTGVVEKLSDAKLKGPGSGAMSAAAEAVGPAFVISQLHKKASTHNNPKVHAESLEWINTTILEFGLQACGKNLLEMAKTSLGSPNAAVRTSATKLLGTMYRTLGSGVVEALRPSVKPALLAAIEAECPSTIEPPPEPIRTARSGVPAVAKKAAGGGSKAAAEKATGAAKNRNGAFAAGGDDDMLPRADISGKITGDLVKSLGSSTWKERQSAVDQVASIVSEAGGRIQPSTGELLPALKQRLSDSNRNLAARVMNILASMCRAMGPAFERQGRILVEPVVKNLGDNKKPVRDAALELLSAFLEVGAGAVVFQEIADSLTALKVEGGKTETLQWLSAKVGEGWVDEPSSVAATAKIAVAGVEDKSSGVRAAGNALLGDVVRVRGPTAVADSLRELDDASRRSVAPHVSKATAGSCGCSSPPRPSSAAAAPNHSAAVRASTARPTTAPASKRLGTAARSTRAGPSSPKGVAAELPPEDSQDVPFSLDDKKEARERKCRGNFKPLNNVSEELAELKEGLSPLVAPHLHRLMFSKECAAHVQAAESIMMALVDHGAALYSNLDRILHWLRLRMSDGNTQCLVKTLDATGAIFADLAASGMQMSDYEASIILPALAERSGHNQDRIRQRHRELLAQASDLLERHVKLADALLDGTRSKNNRTRVECIEELGCLVERHGMAALKVSGKEKVLPIIAKMVGERDKALRGAVLGTLAVIYTLEGDVVWKQMGSLDAMQKSLIEDRFKFVEKEAQKTGTVVGATRIKRLADKELPSADAGIVSALQQHPPAELAQQPRRLAPAMQSIAFPAAVAAAPEDAIMRESVVLPSDNPAAQAPPLPPAVAAAASAMPPRHQGPTTLQRPAVLMTPVMETPSLAAMQAAAPPGSEQRSLQLVGIEWQQGLARLSGDNIPDAVEGMKVLCFELMDAMAQRQPAAGVMDLFADSADKLVSLLSAKSDVIFDEAAASLERDGAPPSSRSLKYVLNTLMQTYQFRDRVLALRVQGPTTEALICRLLVRLLDDRVNSLQEGQQLLKALNVLMLKILEHSNRTHVFCALLTLLRVAPEPIVVQGQAVQQRFSDLVVKCLIKLTKALQSFIGELDVGALLLAIHHFLAGLGAEEIRRRGSEDDKPLRMVKTVLHEVCKVEGYKVVPHLSAVLQREQGDSTIIYNYVDLNLQTLEAAGVIKPSSVPTTPKQSPAVGSPSPAISLSKEQQATPATAAADRCQATPQQTPPSITSTSTPAYSPTGTPGPSQEAKQQLAAIFKKIGDRNSTEKGLEDLYFFKMSNPEIDIGVHLAKTSEAFRKYIQAGLDKVEGRVNRQRAAANGNSHLEEADRHNRLRGRFADSNGPALNPVRVSAQNMENLREKMKQIESGMPVASAHTAVPAGGSRAL